jgi:predicted DNA-binding transcriptional regulator YafY
MKSSPAARPAKMIARGLATRKSRLAPAASTRTPLALLERTGDAELKQAAKRVNQKIAAAVPAPLRRALGANALHAWGTAARSPERIDLALVRRAIRDERKLHIDYRDELGRATQRTIRPLALIYYSQTANIVAWCELRQALRNFRTDRVVEGAAIDEYFRGEGDNLRMEWVAGWKINEGAVTD